MILLLPLLWVIRQQRLVLLFLAQTRVKRLALIARLLRAQSFQVGEDGRVVFGKGTLEELTPGRREV